jgi:hypothetical protein
MGEIAAATIFHQMAAGCKEPVFQAGFRNIGRDEGRHMAICMSVMERDYPKLDVSRKTRRSSPSRSAPATCSSRPSSSSRRWSSGTCRPTSSTTSASSRSLARDAGFHIPDYEAKKENWKRAMLNLKGVLDKYDIPFPAIPEVGIDGQEVLDIDMNEIIPVF